MARPRKVQTAVTDEAILEFAKILAGYRDVLKTQGEEIDEMAIQLNALRHALREAMSD